MTSKPPYIESSITDQVLRVTIDRADKRNALSREVLEGIKSAFDAHRDNDELKVALLRGEGDRSFAAGGDLRELEQLRTAAEAENMSRNCREALDAIRSFPAPVIAVLNGDALGGGAELAAACDARVAAPHARIGFIQGKLAITTAWGGGIDLMRLVGTAKALQLLSRTEILTAAEAVTAGLVNAAGDDENDLDVTLSAYLAPMLELAPQVLRAQKALARAVLSGAPDAALRDVETDQLVATWTHEDHWRAARGVLGPRREP